MSNRLIRPDRMDYMEKGAAFGKPRECVKVYCAMRNEICFSCANHRMELRCLHAGVCKKGKGITLIIDWCNEWEHGNFERTLVAKGNDARSLLKSLYLNHFVGSNQGKVHQSEGDIKI